MPPIFECESLVKNFGGLSAVNHFDLRIE